MRLPRLTFLSALERKALWLSAWMIHHANHVRPPTPDRKPAWRASCLA
jgi:hypothetical protein